MSEQNLLAPGIWPCVVQSGGVGEETDKNDKPTGRMVARVNIQFTDGPNKGRLASYEDRIDARSSPYVLRSLKAAGWRGGFPLVPNVADDIDAFVKRGGATTAEVKHIEIKSGKRYEKWVDAGNDGYPIWDKVNALGRGPRPLAKPSSEALSDAEEQMRRAMAETDGGGDGGDPHADNSDDIPFISCSASVSLGEIAKVLR